MWDDQDEADQYKTFQKLELVVDISFLKQPWTSSYDNFLSFLSLMRPEVIGEGNPAKTPKIRNHILFVFNIIDKIGCCVLRVRHKVVDKVKKD